jgi:DNA helicase-4
MGRRRKPSCRPSVMARLFGAKADCDGYEILPEGVKAYGNQGEMMFAYTDIAHVSAKHFLVWTIIFLELESGVVFSLGAAWRWSSARQSLLEDGRNNFHLAAELLCEHSSLILTTGQWVHASKSGEHWVTHQRLGEVTSALSPIKRVFTVQSSYLTKDEKLAQAVSHVHALHRGPALFRSESNNTFVTAEMNRWSAYLDSIESHPLTTAQRLAVVTNEDRTRVIAGAGSGKTSVVVAKVGYLVKKGLYNPSQMLVVAFNKSAAAEIRARIQQRLGIEVRATTVHSMGLKIIGTATGKKPTLATTAEDGELLVQNIRKLILQLLEVPKLAETVRDYFQSFFAPYKSEFQFDELGDYYAYLQAHDIRTLKGEKVKSFEEAEIANFLFMNDVEYVYEKKYEYNLANSYSRQYQPDFYFPQSGIYLEHFGIDRSGNTAPYIDRVKYAEQIEWKRDIHRKYGTVLVETYSYMKREGKLTSELGRILQEKGVVLRPIGAEELGRLLQERDQLDPFSKLLANFLRHYKSNDHSPDSVVAAAGEDIAFRDRVKAFLRVFVPVYERYEEELRRNGDIDFEDMIVEAARFAETGEYKSPYKCILVDEFQDISPGRARLLQALLGQARHNKLFVVGDDWQAIYRFAGSDIAVMRDFEAHFGLSETVLLDRTFRYNNQIQMVATKFIQANPAQIEKVVNAREDGSAPRVFVHRPAGKGEDVIGEVFKQISQAAGKKKCDVLVLGRYKHNEDGTDLRGLGRQFPRLKCRFKTVHSAKGLEADYVVVVGLSAGRYGFPSEVEDDPLMSIVLSQPEPYEHAEERRLFYVALTRARHEVHLLEDHAAPSKFVTEIVQYEGLVEAKGAALAMRGTCPDCKTGTLLHRTGKRGVFYSCCHYPRCTGTVQACRRCKAGILLPSGFMEHKCSEESCGYKVRTCPECEDGYLIERKGKYGPFYGCSNYRRSLDRCEYTLNIRQRRSNWR